MDDYQNSLQIEFNTNIVQLQLIQVYNVNFKNCI